MSKYIVHIAEIDIAKESGMGRVAWYWREEFQKRGYQFVHIGPKQIGRLRHKGEFPYAAYREYRRLGIKPTLFLVHEPASGPFVGKNIPCCFFSHGLEQRNWNLRLQGRLGENEIPSLRTRILFPLWRLRHCNIGATKADKLLLINQEDAEFARSYYCRHQSHIYVFKNGVLPTELVSTIQPREMLTILFLGSWIERKGIKNLVQAARILEDEGHRLNWLLAGTGLDRSGILSDWPKSLHTSIEVIPRFEATEEVGLFARTNIFVLPSFFEGQPLALLQAMEAGRCCITTNCCGQRDLIQHGHSGLLYEPGDAAKFAALIAQCILNVQMRVNLGTNAKLSVHDRSWEQVSAELADQIDIFLRSNNL